MPVSEFMFIFAMLNICFVCFIWIIKQIILLCHWYYKDQLRKVESDDRNTTSIG